MKEGYMIQEKYDHAVLFDVPGWTMHAGTFQQYAGDVSAYDAVFLFIDKADSAIRILAEDTGHCILNNPLLLIVPKEAIVSFLPALQFPIAGIFNREFFLTNAEGILQDLDTYPAGLCPEGHEGLVTNMYALQAPGTPIEYFVLEETNLPEKMNPQARKLLLLLLNGADSRTLRFRHGYTQASLQHARQKLMEETASDSVTKAVVTAIRNGWTTPVRASAPERVLL
ncbi:hypothetical protein [Alkalicoccus luteus]|uniref:Uncharacterized protein n=1 Tax=Alkalicoccus luteus TaxID=1237094 RepID=A0A969PML8_9BACI|nr:hypothetical protein [Alkalicoccus luteus]NJP36195.1 hypothetical protein [Alkalicoccus luteus]